MRTIVNFEDKIWTLFARPYESYLTGNGAECFAQSFYPEHIGEHERALFQLVDYWKSGELLEAGG